MRICPRPPLSANLEMALGRTLNAVSHLRRYSRDISLGSWLRRQHGSLSSDTQVRCLPLGLGELFPRKIKPRYDGKPPVMESRSIPFLGTSWMLRVRIATST